MKIKKTLLAAGLLMMGFVSASAQQQEPEMENVFNPHWYIQVQPLGGQYTLGEGSFSDMLSYNLQVAGGYNFNKLLGARLAVNAFQSKAGWNYDKAAEALTWKWNYVAPTVDLTLNLSNLMFGYNPERLFTLTAFAGVGANIAWGNDEAAEAKAILAGNNEKNQNLRHLWSGTKARFMGQVGLMGDFRINDNWSVGLELQANTLPDTYNSKKAGNSDWYFNGLVGVKYVFGKSNKKQPVAVPYQPLPETNATEQVVEKIVEKVVEKEVRVETTITDLKRAVFFNKAGNVVISDNEMKTVEEVANFMKKYPSATVSLVGYADRGTGNPKINARLAEQRVNAVAEALKTKFGIDASRITTDSKGCTVQPLEGANNRVVICVATAKEVVKK